MHIKTLKKIGLFCLLFLISTGAWSQSAKLKELLDKMTVEEKIGQLNLLSAGGAVTGTTVNKNIAAKIKTGKVGGIFSTRGAADLNILQRLAVDETRLGIPILFGMDVIHGHKTVFPIPLGLSCTWDMEMIEKSAQIAAKEATAEGLMWTFSPMVDIARDPRWGRIAEGAGEDPYLGSKIAEAMVKGYQQDDLTDPRTMAACVKHFALYGAAEGGRDYATVDMSKVRMYNEFLPPYKAAVDAGVESIMTAFNVIDYVPASANKELYRDILRDEWNFDGMVVTDYTAVNEMIAHGVGDLKEVSAKALDAGIDMDMVGEGMLKTLKQSIDDGTVDMELLDGAVMRVLTLKERLGLFDDPYRYFDESRAATEIFTDEHKAFGRELAAESCVLLKNSNKVLPLSTNQKIALVGPLADSRRNMLGTWSVSGDHSKAVTLKEAILEAFPSENVLYAKGANISDDPIFAKKVNAFGPEIVIDTRTPDQMIAEAVEMAKQSDVIVAAMGEAADMSGESSSLSNIDLQPSQKRLLRELKKLNKPIVMVLFSGRPMTLEWESERLDAILAVWFGGTEGTKGMVDVLVGKVNPSGKLTTSFPINVGQIPVYHSMLNSGRPQNGKYSKFTSGYLDIPNAPLYPFGFGLSYTNFEISVPVLSDSILRQNGEIEIRTTITNMGDVAGAEVVQLYVRDLVGSISRPLIELKGFQKVHLEAKESKEIAFTLRPDDLMFYNSALEKVVEPGEFELHIGNSSDNTKKVNITYKLN